MSIVTPGDGGGGVKPVGLERLLSSSAPEREPIEWLTVTSKREKSLMKKQQKKTADTSKQPTEKAPLKTTDSSRKEDNREELDFMFDEEIAVAPKTSARNDLMSSSESEDEKHEEDDDNEESEELDDQAISKLVIITQTPPAVRKHDRTGDYVPRAKMTADLADAINDGLFYYEKDLMSKTESTTTVKTVDLISREEFEKLRNLDNEDEQNSERPPAIEFEAPVVATRSDYSQVVQNISITKPKSSSQSFGPHSLPTDTVTPSLKQLMSHVNAIKTGAITDKHARASMNVATSRHRARNESFTLSDSKKTDLSSSSSSSKKKSRRSANSRFYPVVKEPSPSEPGAPQKSKTRHSNNPPVESHVGWVMDNTETLGKREHRSSTGRSRNNSNNYSGSNININTNTNTSKPMTNGVSTGTTPVDDSSFLSSSYAQSQALMPFHHPSYTLLNQNGFTQQLYGKFRKRCLAGKYFRHLSSIEVKFTAFDGLERAFFTSCNVKQRISLINLCKIFFPPFNLEQL